MARQPERGVSALTDDTHPVPIPLTVSDNRNVVLTGFMGTGKTTVGRLLATRLGYTFVDTDHVLQDRHGSIASIFATQGEAAFRQLERGLATELAGRSRLVISTGGRMMLDPANVTALSDNGRVFCLVATPEQIFGRVLRDADGPVRPLLSAADPRERIVELLAERRDGYGRFPQLRTDDLTPAAIAEQLAGFATVDPKRFAVGGPSGGYDYCVGIGVLPCVRQLVGINGPVVLVTSDDIAERYGPSFGPVDLIIELPNGPASRTLASVQQVYDALLAVDADRTATIISLGGSIIGDVAGFAAATYLGGLNLVHCPTDLFAMLDTSIGGNVGLDLPQGNNRLGLHKQPKAVIADVATLQTVPPQEFTAGLAEVVKLALLGGGDLIGMVEAVGGRRDRQLPRELDDLHAMVTRAIEMKIDISRDDPVGQRRRALLQLGHIFADAFEHVAGDSLLPGEALATGLIAAARLSVLVGEAKPDVADRVEELVSLIGLGPATIMASNRDPDKVLHAMQRDNNRLSGPARFILLRDIGAAFEADHVARSDVRAVLAGL